MNEIRKAAEDYVSHGLSVIPLNGKKPAIPWGTFQHRLPTKDELDSWFADIRHNIGLVCGKIVVKDFDDMDKGRSYFKTNRDRIKTVVLTPRPGVHFYFRNEGGNRNTQGDKEDVRGAGGYVVAPPSVVDGKPYRFLEGYGFVPPEELCPMPEEEPKAKVQEVPIQEDDRLTRISRAIAYVDKCDPSISGQGGHSALFRVCCKLVRKFELSESEAWPIVLRFNERASPSWSEADLRRKLKEARKTC